MLLEIGKRTAIAHVGHDEGTTTREMVTALRRGGFLVAPRMRRFDAFESIPTPRALLLGFWRQYPHWMAFSRGQLYDPVEGVFDVRRAALPRRLRVTHFLALSRHRAFKRT